MLILDFAKFAILGFAAFAAVLAMMIIFGRRNPPPMLKSMNDEGLEKISSGAEHEVRTFQARDGAAIGYREFLAGGEQIAILVHGSSADGRAMQAIGNALASRGITAYALDIRGHGVSGRRGDIDYVGQLEDDLTDFIQLLRQTHPRARLALIGHSSGGGFSLRFAGGKYGALFDRYVLAAPFIHHAVATTRPGSGGWARAFLPRLIALTILDTMGLKWFQHLPVLAFAIPPGRDDLTGFYSYRLQSNFRPDRTKWKEQIAAINRPVAVIVGENDELFLAAAYEAMLKPLSPQISVRILPGLGHTDIYAKPQAVDAIAAALS